MCEACGAVTGAFMVPGLIYGQNTEGDTDSRVQTYLFVKDFTSGFKKYTDRLTVKNF